MKGIRERLKPCQYNYKDLADTTSPDPRLALPLRRYWWTLKRHVWYSSNFGPSQYMLKLFRSEILGKFTYKRKRNPHARPTKRKSEALNLQPGEWVEVRSVKEIFTTLDKEGKLRGLRFTREMAKYCGKRFKVYKRLEKLILETTGELRTIRTPTVLLEGVFCDGKFHGGCDRSCFIFWREAWLKRVLSQASTEK
jgi:hypothetical protein